VDAVSRQFSRLLPSVLLATATLLLAPEAASAAWKVSETPNVPAAADTSLNAVDCTSANSCMAVGSALAPPQTGMAGSVAPRAPGPNLIPTTVAEHWDGTSWQIVPTPNPSGANLSSLSGVSCPWRNVCFAVGQWREGSTDPLKPPGITRPLVELWNGTSWSIQPSPDVTNGTLQAISCSGLLACTAVGNFYDQTTFNALAERWDGTGWHVQSTPEPSGAENELFSVSCPRRRTCTAVGSSRAAVPNGNGATTTSPLVMRWFGHINAWGLQTVPKPAGAGDTALAGVSCPDARVCFAIGVSFDSAGHSSTTLAERRVGSRWSIMPTPNPGPFLSPFGLIFQADLSSVSCPGRRACHAVGYGRDSTGDLVVIGERFDGANWQLESIPVTSPLADVSCPSRLFCMAVGRVDNGVQGTTEAAKWTP
jgi:hypothetical protein